MKTVRLSTASFVIPDTRLANVVYLKSVMDEVELLYMDSANEYDLPDVSEVEELSKLDISYNVHLPYDVDYGSDEGWETLKSFYDALKGLNVSAWTIHSGGDVSFFIKKLDEFIDYSGAVVTVENIHGNYDHLDAVMKSKGYICCDVGHIVEEGGCVNDFLCKYGEKIKLFHIHGVDEKRDHKSLVHLDKNILKTVLEFAAQYNIVVSVEVFNEDDFKSSLKVLEEYFA